MSKVTNTYSGGQIYYDIEGDDLTDIEETIARIEKAYHPLGYGTTFERPEKVDGGRWMARGHRSSSCD